jgi:hypothetical protein
VLKVRKKIFSVEKYDTVAVRVCENAPQLGVDPNERSNLTLQIEIRRGWLSCGTDGHCIAALLHARKRLTILKARRSL